jgi:CHAD domain-containing protein
MKYFCFNILRAAPIQDELIGRQRDMEVMEQWLEEYSAIIHTQEDTIGSMLEPKITRNPKKTRTHLHCQKRQTTPNNLPKWPKHGRLFGVVCLEWRTSKS